MFRRRASQLFIVQSDRPFGSVSDRRMIDDVEQAISNQPFAETGSHAPRMGSLIPRSRLVWACGILSCLFLLFTGRSAYLQINLGDHYRSLAEANQYREIRVLPQRGLIYDRHGTILAKNVPSFLLTMTIADLPKEEKERRALFEHVGVIAGVQPTDFDLLLTEYAKTPHEAIPVKQHLPYERAMHLAIETKRLPGFTLQTSSLREYPSATLSLSHVLGYTGKISTEELDILRADGYRAIDTLGKLGVEKSAEKTLRGEPGQIVVEVDSRGKELSVVSKTDPSPGTDIHLSLDAGFQAFIESRMEALFAATRTSRGSVVALNPKTGEIYALVSLPSYDNNEFAKGIDSEAFQTLVNDPDKPLFSRAVSGEFPSGSTFKPFVAYAALAERIISAHTSFVSTGGLRIGEWFFPDWRGGGHGVTDVTKAIADSVNTFFYIIGGGYDQFNGLGVQKITDYARRFGFGSQTGIDLPAEADGFLPSKEWKEEAKGERWYVGDTYHLAIGQGDFLTTPLQMASATGVIANNGVRIKPSLILDKTKNPSEPIDHLDSSALSIVKRAMRETVLTGSARSLYALPFSVAAKTGTAQAPGKERYHSWFTGFAPYDDPEIAIAILIEEGGESTDAAVPLAKEVFSWWFLSRTSQ